MLGYEICYPIIYIVNKAIKTSSFLNNLKCAQVTPVYKRGDPLDKANYRPISVLPFISKVFEGLMLDQLLRTFDQILSQHVSGFRKGFGCQNVLMKFVEDCKAALDERKVCGALLTDLSKSFDCLP